MPAIPNLHSSDRLSEQATGAKSVKVRVNQPDHHVLLRAVGRQ